MNQKQKPMNKKAVHNENLIHREIYNPNKFAVKFILTLDWGKAAELRAANIPRGAFEIMCEPDGFCYLPHAYYVAVSINGPEIFDMLQNFGDQMRIGNKKKSLPMVENR